MIPVRPSLLANLAEPCRTLPANFLYRQGTLVRVSSRWFRWDQWPAKTHVAAVPKTLQAQLQLSRSGFPIEGGGTRIRKNDPPSGFRSLLLHRASSRFPFKQGKKKLEWYCKIHSKKDVRWCKNGFGGMIGHIWFISTKYPIPLKFHTSNGADRLQSGEGAAPVWLTFGSKKWS